MQWGGGENVECYLWHRVVDDGQSHHRVGWGLESRIVPEV